MNPLGSVWGIFGVRPIRERAGSAKPTTELWQLITAQQGFLGGSAVGCPLNGREKAWLMEGHYRVPSLFSKRSNPALRPGAPP